uniref:Uncharacterized protein n=1 Tax=Meloidogyne enterolobii TaxID=390850 RepID=A0A6V7W8N6_MELEN|nr:unnamed protein product [Meloidogyne enterolobii]
MRTPKQLEEWSFSANNSDNKNKIEDETLVEEAEENFTETSSGYPTHEDMTFEDQTLEDRLLRTRPLGMRLLRMRPLRMRLLRIRHLRIL